MLEFDPLKNDPHVLFHLLLGRLCPVIYHAAILRHIYERFFSLRRYNILFGHNEQPTTIEINAHGDTILTTLRPIADEK